MDKRNAVIWRISLLVLSIVTVIWVVCGWAGIALPAVCVRVMGMLDIAALPVLVHTSIKNFFEKNG